MDPVIKIEFNTVIAKGTNIVAVWPTTTPLPSQSALNAAAAEFGEPFVLSYLSYGHAGVTIAEDVNSLDVYQAFADATGGNTPLIVALSPDYETIVSIEQKAAYFKGQVKKLSSGAIDLVTPPLLPDSGVVRTLIYVAAGVVILGGAIYVYKRFFSRKRR